MPTVPVGLNAKYAKYVLEHIKAMAGTPTPVGNTTAAADADADAPAQAVPHKAKLLNLKFLK